ncbi:hypothetical protein EVAR_16305_1 [Eumeta japonica]|uniref:Uncharacterized protein n=1 Tax=Eumeta variegata TaxID=151549 RepID=A0A4C1VFM8_EUMVA|nr:hypothetical protein EVAR_16305_1 [Eumeta japonica]
MARRVAGARRWQVIKQINKTAGLIDWRTRHAQTPFDRCFRISLNRAREGYAEHDGVYLRTRGGGLNVLRVRERRRTPRRDGRRDEVKNNIRRIRPSGDSY